MTTGELAKRLDVPRSTVNHWVTRGYINVTPKRVNPFSERTVADISDQEVERIERLYSEWQKKTLTLASDIE